MSQSEIIWVTGASTGIGRALAEQFAQQGHRVIASARSLSKLEQPAGENLSASIHLLPCDVVDKVSLQQAAQHIQDKFGHIDKVIVNAGTCEYFSIKNPDWEMMRRVMEVNYFGAINTIEVALPLLRQSPHNQSPHNQGHIVALASMATDVAFPRAQAYGGSKAALKYFFESLRVDLAVEKIAVTVVQPGFVATPLTAKNDFLMPFMISAEQAANTIIAKLNRKPFLIRFPRRLSWLLAIMSRLPSLWHYFAVHQLTTSAAPAQSRLGN